MGSSSKDKSISIGLPHELASPKNLGALSQQSFFHATQIGFSSR
jgi:hypothetical protein